jgi:Ca2+-binding RTX toxin-like protein
VGAGISASDLTVSRTGVDLLITHSNGRDQLRVQGWYADGNAQWLSLQFSDDTHLSAGQLTEAGLTVHASPAGDTLRGLAAYPNTLLGGAGNDAITGGYLGDVLSGGMGNDLLAGGAGDDTYVYNIGDGVDTILDTATVTGPNSLVFGPAITPDMLSLGLGSLLIRVGTDGGAIRLQSFDPNNVYGSHAIENFRFADGERLTYADLIARGFDLFGTEGDDTITGTSVTDRIDGLAGDDRLLGGAGSDTYVFGPGSGQDLIREAAASGDMDTLQVLANPGDVRVTREAANVVVSLAATTDRVAIDWYTDPGARIERVVFADGTTWDAATLEAQVEGAVNRPPVVVNPLADRSATEDTAFSFAVPADTFVDPDAGDTLSYSAALTDGSPLPAWLTFEPMTRTFSGTPLNANVGTIGIRVTVTDRGSLNASDEFCLTVINTNDPPTVATPIPAQTATEDLAFSFTIPEGAFQDVDGDELTYALPIFLILPGWLGFDASTGTFFGTPLNEDVGTITVSVEARDGGLSPATASFALTVLNTNDAPQVVEAHPPAIIQEGTPYSETVRDLFWDPDLDDVLTYRAKLGDGSPLPDWLAFDPETASFSGTPGPAGMGFWRIRITATDAGGLSAFTFLELTVTPQPGVVLTGTAGADTLIGRSGNDVIDGLRGPDTMIGMHGDDTYYVDNPSDLVLELPAQGNDSVFSSIDYTLPANVENLTLTGGAKINGTGNALANLLVGNGNNNVLSGGEGDDTLDGGAGSDKMIGGGGNDTYIVDNDGDRIVESANGGIDTVLSRISLTLGADVENLILLGSAALKGKGNAADNALVGNTAANELSGEDGNDLLQGGAGGDKLAGGSGNDILQGEDGDDSLDEGSGNGMLDGGAGRDSLKSGSGNDLLIGGTGDDLLTPGSGADVIAFNLGDGQDTVKAGGGADNTLSLGGGIRYADLSFARSGNNLVLNIGAGDGLAFVNWYSSSANRSVLNLQVIAEAMAEFDAGSADPLLNRKVQQFDFQALAAAFDAAGQVSGWALTDALLDAHLAGSDTEALGGDLAYQYGLNNTLSGIGLDAAQDVLNAPQFGVRTQALRPLEQLQQGQLRLA